MEVHRMYHKLSQFNFMLKNSSCTGRRGIDRDTRAPLQHQHEAKLQEVVLEATTAPKNIPCPSPSPFPGKQQWVPQPNNHYEKYIPGTAKQRGHRVINGRLSVWDRSLNSH